MNLRTNKIYSLFIMVLYLMFGFLLLMKYSFWQEESNLGLALFGVVVIGYGIFRGYRAFKTTECQKNEKDEIE